MSEAATVTIQTQPAAPKAEATIADVNEAPAQAADAAVTTEKAAEGEKPAETQAVEEKRELTGDKWAKIAKQQAKIRARERELEAREKQAQEVMAWREALKTKKGTALLAELGLDPEEHLQDVILNGKPDPARDAVELARQAKAEAEALRKQLAEQEQAQAKQREMAQLRAGISACADFISSKVDEYPHAAKLLEGEELQRAIFNVHRQAEQEGLSLTFPQVAKKVEAHAKTAYEYHEQRRLKFAGATALALKEAEQTSEAGPRATRPVNTLTNQHASQSATIGRPEKTRAERKRELIAELEARAAAKR